MKQLKEDVGISKELDTHEAQHADNLQTVDKTPDLVQGESTAISMNRLYTKKLVVQLLNRRASTVSYRLVVTASSFCEAAIVV